MKPERRDEFGGTLEVVAGATGFFRVEKLGTRWWFITPRGHGFLSVACNHLEAGFLRASYNREYWRDIAADRAKFTQLCVDDAKSWNMTALGYGDSYDPPDFPYVRRLNLPGLSTWQPEGEFPDPFEPEFTKILGAEVKRRCESVRDDPFLIGYLLSDCLEWPQLGRASKRRALNWVDDLKARDGRSAGKRAYLELMRTRYASVADFNAVYGTDFNRWSKIWGASDWVYGVPSRPDAARDDDAAFLELLARRYNGVACAAIRTFDPNHLVLGETFEGNRGLPDALLEVARDEFDALCVQFYGNWKDHLESLHAWHEATGLPILLADSCFSCTSEAMPHTCGPRMADHQARAEAFERYARAALRCPFVIGWHWCGWIDGSLELEARQQHQGLKDAWGNEHQPLCDRIRAVFSRLYDLARAAH